MSFPSFTTPTAMPGTLKVLIVRWTSESICVELKGCAVAPIQDINIRLLRSRRWRMVFIKGSYGKGVRQSQV
jgi:hypothetical protein